MLPEPLKVINKEVFAVGNQPYMIKVELIPFSEWSHTEKGMFEDQLLKDRRAQIGLDILGIVENDERIKKFAYCKNGVSTINPIFLTGNTESFNHEKNRLGQPKRNWTIRYRE